MLRARTIRVHACAVFVLLFLTAIVLTKSSQVWFYSLLTKLLLKASDLLFLAWNDMSQQYISVTSLTDSLSYSYSHSQSLKT